LNQFRGLRVGYEKRADIHQAFLSLGCPLICRHSLQTTFTIALFRSVQADYNQRTG
jgi:hypothetical protein